MEQVTLGSLTSFIDRYAESRRGILNEETSSEAMFVFQSKFGGAYVLTTGVGIIWIGLQNASARWSHAGKLFQSVHAAIERALTAESPIQTIGAGVFYSEDSVARLRWIADRIEAYKESGTFLLHIKD